MSTEPRNRPRNLQHQAEHTRVNRRINVMGYLAVLFVVAFLLLGFAYLQQQRINKETTDALKDSSSAFQSIQNLMEEKETLQKQVEELEEQLESTTAQLQQSQFDEARSRDTVVALQYFWQINEAYVRGRYTLCRQLIQEFEDAVNPDCLPTEKIPENDRFSPADRYQEIHNALY